MSATLAGIRVLVTRPEPKASRLSAKIVALDGEATAFPTIEILPIVDEPLIQSLFSSPSHYHWGIFTSTYAVDALSRQLREQALPFQNTAAIGSATAAKLIECRVEPTIVADPADSETLLSSSQLQTIDGQKILLLAGEGGRTLIAETLTSRGAKIAKVELYRRELPKKSTDLIEKQFKSAHYHAIIITSLDALKNLMTMLGSSAHVYLHSTPLIVVSRRIKDAADQMGFNHIVIANGSDDEVVVNSLVRYWDERTESET